MLFYLYNGQKKKLDCGRRKINILPWLNANAGTYITTGMYKICKTEITSFKECVYKKM